MNLSWEDSRNHRASVNGWARCWSGYFENEDFVYAGKLGTGFNSKLLLELRARLDPMEIPKTPFTKAVGLPRLRAHWVHPTIAV
jgi:bifunctional non-homologous end joining protein LigD